MTECEDIPQPIDHFIDEKYYGNEKFLVSMDIGTIYTSVSFSHCYPNARTRTQMVTRWPGTEGLGSTKIPSIVSYQRGELQACGVEALKDLKENAKNVAYAFKLHLHPPSMPTPPDLHIPDLPDEITIEKVYGDFMHYLMENTRRFFESTTPNGAAIWSRGRQKAIIILTVPSTWGSRQREVLTNAAIHAGLFAERDAVDLLHFVTQAEASLHFALLNRTAAWLEVDSPFALMDIDGSTVDAGVYDCTSTSPTELREVFVSDCILTGGMLLDEQVERLLSDKLQGWQRDSPEVIKDLMHDFEKEAKRKFDGSTILNVVNYRSPVGNRWNFKKFIKHKILQQPDSRKRSFQISLSNAEIKSAFSSIEKRILEFRSQMLGGAKVKYLLLVGGFGESPYLKTMLSEALRLDGITLVSVEDCCKKAVAEGAIIWYIHRLVKERANKVILPVDGQVYNATEKFVIYMDIGTVQISIARFAPGLPPQSQIVTEWPGQSDETKAAKIPSIVSYQNGKRKACGQEATTDLTSNEKDVARLFKLHVHPQRTMPSLSNFDIPKLPAGVTIRQVYVDMMAYLMENTRRFYEGNNANGTGIWSRLRDSMIIVLSTPNGWDMPEQSFLRDAAIKAGLVAAQDAQDLIQFVTEAEASVYATLSNHQEAWLKNDTIFAVVDAGGSTVDATLYDCKSINPLELRKVCPSESMQTGGIFVNLEVEKLLTNKLAGSSFNRPPFIKKMVNAFERDVKPSFDGSQPWYSLRFGGPQDNDPTFRIEKGSLSLPGEALARAYNAVEKRILDGCSEMMRGRDVKYVHLLGGFGASPYLQKAFVQRFATEATKVMLPDTSSLHKRQLRAPMEGVAISHMNQVVKARAARATFGANILIPYSDTHWERFGQSDIHYDGRRMIKDGFDMWVEKGTSLEDTFAYKTSYQQLFNATRLTPQQLAHYLGYLKLKVFAWQGSGVPIWCTDDKGVFRKEMRLLCTLTADLSAIAPSLQQKRVLHGKMYYQVEFDVCVFFGGTQVRARLQWYDKSVLREGPIEVIPYVAET